MLDGIIKLSELKDDEMLLVGDDLAISKEDYIREIQEYMGKEVYTTIVRRASIDARSMLEDAIKCVAQEMYEDWEDDIWNDITKDDIRDIQLILNRIFNKSNNISYFAYKKVEVDI